MIGFIIFLLEFHGIIIYRAIYFGAYDTAKAMVDNPTFMTKFAIAQVSNFIIMFGAITSCIGSFCL